MKFVMKVFLSAVTMTCGSIIVSAQAPVQTNPAKVGFVNTANFSRSTGGITRFVNAMRTLDNEFKARRDEITQLGARFEELQKTPAGMTEPQLAARREQAQSLQIEITRKQEDARSAYTRRFAQLTEPIQKSIVDALTAFAKARGIDALIDVSKFPEGVLVVNESTDLTEAFIRDFNAKNP